MTKEQRKQQRRKAQVPAPRIYNVRVGKPDENGEYNQVQVKATFGIDKITLATIIRDTSVSCTFVFGTAPVERKVKMFGKVLRGKNGNPLLVSVDLPSTLATLSISGKKFSARSFCKPPDVFSRHAGIKYALRHLLRQPGISLGGWLEQEDFEALVKVCLTKPPSPSKIKHAQKVAQKKALQKAAK